MSRSEASRIAKLQQLAYFLLLGEQWRRGHAVEVWNAKLKEFEGALLASRRELRAVRHSIRAEVDRLGKRLTLLNLLAGPVQVGLLAIGVFFYRRRQTARLSGADHVVSSG